MDSRTPGPRSEAEGVARERSAWNRRYARPGAVLAFGGALLFLFQHLLAPGPLGPLAPSWLGLAYHVAYLVLASSSFVFLIFFTLAGKKAPDGRLERILLLGFAFIASGLGVLLSIFDLYTGRDYLGLLAGMLCTCLLVSAHRFYYLAMGAWGLALFSAGFLIFHAERGFSDFVGGVFSAVFPAVLGFLAERSRREQISAIMTLKGERAERENAAVRDGLTGAYNGAFLIEFLSRMAAGGARYRQELSIIVLDIDRLGRINENFGREAADGILSEFGAALAAMIRSSDVLARLDGGRFAVILPQTDGLSAAAVAERLRLSFQEKSFRGVKSLLSVSAGVASLQPEEDVGALVSRADSALRRAKAGGRNRVELN